MPKIGLRIIKSAIAVSVCLIIDIVLLSLWPQIEFEMYSPFFAGLATVYSISNNRNNSFKLARIRSIGSVIGSVVAVLVVLFFELVVLPATGITNPIVGLSIKYFLVAIFLIALIYFTVITKQTDATFVSCLTYLSVTVGNRTTLAPTLFALNRTLSTIVGVLIALLINFISLKRHRNKDILFVVGVDNVITNETRPISPYAKFSLNELIRDDCNVVISTIRSPASLTNIFSGVEFKLPQIVMNGAAIYDINKAHYDSITAIDPKTRVKIEEIFDRDQLNYFAHVIMDDTLTIYYKGLSNDGERRFYENRKNSYFKNYARGLAPQDESVVFYVLVNTKEIIERIAYELVTGGLVNDLDIVVYKFSELEGDYYNLKIRSGKATKLQALDALKSRINTKYVVAIGNNNFDIPLLNKADYAVCLCDSNDDVKAVCGLVINAKKRDAVVRTIKHLYYSRNVIRSIERLKKNKAICRQKYKD